MVFTFQYVTDKWPGDVTLVTLVLSSFVRWKGSISNWEPVLNQHSKVSYFKIAFLYFLFHVKNTATGKGILTFSLLV